MQSSALNEGTNKLPEKLTVKKKIDKKICGSTVSESQATDSKNIKANKCTNDDETSIKNIKHNTCTISTADKKDDTGDAIKKQERDPRIPDWLPEKDDVIVIEPTKKPPHLRSKVRFCR